MAFPVAWIGWHNQWCIGGRCIRTVFVASRVGWFNIKMASYQYGKSHCGDKTVVRSSYLHNEISYTGKTPALYWIRALQSDTKDFISIILNIYIVYIRHLTGNNICYSRFIATSYGYNRSHGVQFHMYVEDCLLYIIACDIADINDSKLKM